MKKLLLMRGIPRAGKSKWLETNGLGDYVIEPDRIRLMLNAPAQDAMGNLCLDSSRGREALVWEIVMTMLESRMKSGSFTVIDAMNIKDLSKIKELAAKYRYRIYVKQIDVALEDALARTVNSGYKAVPARKIEEYYEEINRIGPLGSWCTPIDTVEDLYHSPLDYSGYRNIYHIGDLQGCHTVLKRAFEIIGDPEENPDNLYIFVGDLVDRGIENADVIKTFMRLSHLENVTFLEGNHERWLFDYVNNVTAKSEEFEKRTKPQLDEAGIDKRHLSECLKRLAQCSYYKYRGKIVLVTHAGLHAVPLSLHKVSTDGFIYGYGGYEADIDTAFNQTHANSEVYQVHGHRNTLGHPLTVNTKSFNLEGKVEFEGGHLRIATLGEEGWSTLELENTVYKKGTVGNFNEPRNDVMGVVRQMRYLPSLITERTFDHISSFSFSRSAWNKKQWSALTTKARGFFVDCLKGEVVARSYDKFFNLNEMPATSFKVLPESMTYPVTWYEKENGFLGLVGWDSTNAQLWISSKATTGNEYSGYLLEILKRDADLVALKTLAAEGYCFAFEVIHPNDPHIIDYEGVSKVVLLDMFKRTIKEEPVPYSHLQEVAKELGVECKRIFRVSETPEELAADLITYRESTVESEGWVLTGANNFRTKIKLPYYNFWKSLRSKLEAVNKGVTPAVLNKSQGSEEAKAFIRFVAKNYAVGEVPPLIEARKAYFASKDA